MRMDTTKMIVTFRNFVKLPKNTATYTTILPPLGLVEGKCVFDNFLFPKFHSSKFKIFLFSAQILRLNFMPNFQKLFKTFSKKIFRWVYSNLLVEFEGGPQAGEYGLYCVI